jgi:hypothetical protein
MRPTRGKTPCEDANPLSVVTVSAVRACGPFPQRYHLPDAIIPMAQFGSGGARNFCYCGHSATPAQCPLAANNGHSRLGSSVGIGSRLDRRLLCGPLAGATWTRIPRSILASVHPGSGLYSLCGEPVAGFLGYPERLPRRAHRPDRQGKRVAEVVGASSHAPKPISDEWGQLRRAALSLSGPA